MWDPPWLDGLTIGAVLRQTAGRFPDRDAVVFPRLDTRWSWRELDELVDRSALGLLSLGFQRGDHFGVWATSCPEWVVLQFAAARIGVVLVTINPAYRLSELAFALGQSEVRGLALIDHFKSTDYDALLEEVCGDLDAAQPGKLDAEQCPKLEWLIRLRGAVRNSMLGYNDLLDAGASADSDLLRSLDEQLEPDDPINLQYTSGTTGRPKGALLTHRNLLLNAYYCGECQRLTESDRICVPVPLYHCFGCVLGTLCAAVSGAALVFPDEGFDAERTLEAIDTERCTAIYGVPTMFIAMLEHPTYAGRDTSSLRTGIMAGSPCPIELMKRVTHEMGAAEITIAYGQTEASPLITMTRTVDPIEKRVGTVGQVLPGVEAKIVDPQTGEDLPDEVEGELCTRGHNVMQCYFNMPEQTAEVIDADGWLHTRDISLRHADGFFRITGRLKDMIIRGGENIAPREIEELLYRHPKVEDAQVVGVPSRKFGEEILVWVKLREGQEETVEAIREFCRAQLSHFKTPRYVKFVDSFPTTVTGKIQKFRIREQAIEELGLHEDAQIETA